MSGNIRSQAAAPDSGGVGGRGKVEKLNIYTADFDVSMPDIFSCQFNVTKLGESGQRAFVTELQDVLRSVDEKWSKAKVRGSGKRITQFLAKVPGPDGGYVREVRVKFIPLPQSLINRINRVRGDVYVAVGKYSLSPADASEAPVAGEERVVFKEGSPLKTSVSRSRYMSGQQMLDVMKAIEEINREDVEEVNREIEKFEASEDFAAIEGVIKKHLGLELPKGRRYPKVRVVFSTPTVFQDEFYKKLSQDLAEAKVKADTEKQELLRKMIQDVEQERQRLFESLRASVNASVKEALDLLRRGDSTGKKVYYEAAKASIAKARGFDLILGAEDTADDVLEYIDAKTKGDEERAAQIMDKLRKTYGGEAKAPEPVANEEEQKEEEKREVVEEEQKEEEEEEEEEEESEKELRKKPALRGFEHLVD